MQYNFILVRTDRGRKYARKILNSVKWLNENKYPQHEFTAVDLTIAEFMSESLDWWRQFNPSKTIIHARAANPRTKWTIRLRELEKLGYKVVNSVDCIELTSNKLACSLHLQGKVNHPKSWEWNKSNSDNLKTLTIDNILDNLWDGWGNDKYLIAKPLISLEQGANVRKININNYWDIGAEIIRADELVDEIEKVPGNKIVIQEYIPYTALHRVVVINGKALPYTFIDKPEWHENGDWKVSCCLNKTTMKLNENVIPELLELAEKTQKEVGGIINFIDIFEVNKDRIVQPNNEGPWGIWAGNGYYTLSEINTACSLNIHERLARNAGRTDYNIHYRIAKELIKQLGV